MPVHRYVGVCVLKGKKQKMLITLQYLHNSSVVNYNHKLALTGCKPDPLYAAYQRRDDKRGGIIQKIEELFFLLSSVQAFFKTLLMLAHNSSQCFQ